MAGERVGSENASDLESNNLGADLMRCNLVTMKALFTSQKECCALWCNLHTAKYIQPHQPTVAGVQLQKSVESTPNGGLSSFLMQLANRRAWICTAAKCCILSS